MCINKIDEPKDYPKPWRPSGSDVILIVVSHGQRNCGVLLQDTGARRGMALQGQQPNRRLFIGIRKVQSGRALVGSQRRCHSTVPAPHTRCDQRRRIGQGPAQPWRRALLRRSAPRRGAALGGAVGAGLQRRQRALAQRQRALAAAAGPGAASGGERRRPTR